MKKVIICKGLPGSGKSTWAKEQVQNSHCKIKRVSKDDLRAMFDNSKWSRNNEKFILDMRDQCIKNILMDGEHVIVDDTNLAPKHEAHIRELVKGIAEVEVKFFDVDVEECIRRDSTREKKVGEKVIRDMYEQYLKPAPEIYKPDPSLPKAIIVDIDNTIALKGNRSPFEWSRVGEDIKNEPICTLIGELCGHHALKQDILTVLFCSGRDSICRPETEKWLEENIKWPRGMDSQLFMRPEGNNEKDSIIKKRIFEENIRGKYNILWVFDDRDQVVDTWRSLGLTCLQVADGSF